MSSIIKITEGRSFQLAWGGWVFTPSWLSFILLLLGLILFLSLGMWQLGRAEFKQELIDLQVMNSRKITLNNEDVDLLLEQKKDIRFMHAELSGYHRNELIILQNQMLNSIQGYFVYTPFVLDKASRAVLINWGWRALDSKREFIDHIDWKRAYKVRGFFDRSATGISVANENYESLPYVLATMNQTELEAALKVNLLPYELRIVAPNEDGFMRDWKLSKQGSMPPEKHRAYAFQWFSLALTACVLFLIFTLKKEDAL